MKALQLLPILLAALVVAGLLGFVGWNVIGAQSLPEGPADVVWDREPCAHCRMHLGEPAFAAQLQTADGRVLCFDDPGCAFEYLDEHNPEVHELYFRHLREPRWIAAAAVSFVDVEHSPMGYRLGAVEAGTATGTATDALSLDQARARVRRAGAEQPDPGSR